MDYREKVFNEADPLKQLMMKIPGFQGYYNKEMRRDADKLLRDHLAGQLAQQRDRLSQVQSNLVQAKAFETVGQLDRAMSKLQTLIDRIRTATYGYAGLFDAAKVDEQALDRIYQFDAALASGVDAISGLISKLSDVSSQKAVQQSEIDDAVRALSQKFDELNTTFDRRRDAMMGQM